MGKLNNNSDNSKSKASLAGIRIDERGGIYMNPLLDSNSAYFKCYVAELSGQIVGYILFFNTLKVICNARQDPVAVVQDLFVKPNRRRQGIGSQLLLKVVETSIDKGCESLEVTDQGSGRSFFNRRLNANSKDGLWILSRPEMHTVLTLGT